MYVPMYVDIYRLFWRGSRDAIAQFMLPVVAWLLYRDRVQLLSNAAKDNSERRPFVGFGLLTIGLMVYVAGRSQFAFQLQSVSQIPVLYGLAFLLLNAAGRRHLWFPVGLLLFLIPVPGSVLDELLAPLKQMVSELVTWFLYSMGYPVARDGVVLTIGNYELLVADACSGLNSMVALTGVGLLYVYLARNASRGWNATLLLSILPIAFAANVLRVLALVLITYYAGDKAGRAFHGRAGYIEIATVFGCFFGLDGLLRILIGSQPAPSHAGQLRC
jgi:exosortase